MPPKNKKKLQLQTGNSTAWAAKKQEAHEGPQDDGFEVVDTFEEVSHPSPPPPQDADTPPQPASLPDVLPEDDGNTMVPVPKKALLSLESLVKLLASSPYAGDAIEPPAEIVSAIQGTALTPVLSALNPVFDRLNSAESAFKQRLHSPTIDKPPIRPFESLESRLAEITDTVASAHSAKDEVIARQADTLLQISTTLTDIKQEVSSLHSRSTLGFLDIKQDVTRVLEHQDDAPSPNTYRLEAELEEARADASQIRGLLAASRAEAETTSIILDGILDGTFETEVEVPAESETLGDSLATFRTTREKAVTVSRTCETLFRRIRQTVSSGSDDNERPGRRLRANWSANIANAFNNALSHLDLVTSERDRLASDLHALQFVIKNIGAGAYTITEWEKAIQNENPDESDGLDKDACAALLALADDLSTTKRRYEKLKLQVRKDNEAAKLRRLVALGKRS